jgi:hypothetical protein
MADGIKISQLPQLTQANLDDNDEIPIVDVSDRATKRVTKSALLAAPFDPIDVNSGTIDGTTIGASSPSTGAFTTLNVGSSTTVNGVLDEDNMASDDPAKLATQQSIKAYVDAQVATSDTLSEVLANGNTTGGTNLVVSAADVITTDTINETTIASGVTVDGVLLKDSQVNADVVGNVTGNLTGNVTGDITSTGTSTFSSIDINGGTIDGITDLAVADGGTGASTAAGARTNLNVDVAGTDNSTNVTLAGTPDYLTLSGQEITLNNIDLTTDVTGALPVANGGTGSTTAADARTALDVDQAGTDNSTNVTLAGAYDYLTLSGQQITLDQIDLATDVSGALPTANLTVVNSNTGSFGSSTLVPVITVNDKGLITAVTTATVSGGGTVDLTTDVTGILPIANGGTNASTAAGARTNLDVDQAGTAVALAIALG